MKTILFDFDGTVADTLPAIFASFRSTFQRFLARHYSDREIVNLFGPAEIAILQSQIPADQHEMAIEHFFQMYSDLHRTILTPPAIFQMLSSLSEAGMQLGIVTGKGRRSADIPWNGCG
jgi:phosphoglycolate phosphatase/pyrophosphatase PpaX